MPIAQRASTATTDHDSAAAGQRHTAVGAEFDRQLQTLLDLGYPALAGLSDADFAALVSPLRAVALRHVDRLDIEGRAPQDHSTAPFVLVVSTDLVPAKASMPLTSLSGKRTPGFVDASAHDIERFRPIEGLAVPAGPAYLVIDVDRGAETLNVRPDDALVTITEQGRTPLTVDEGIALITQFPELLAKNNCFSLVGSRCGDRRVPALWISKNAPKLGWCWAGNPHTWLGSASVKTRAGLPPARLADPA